jgi:hypothetical protein
LSVGEDKRWLVEEGMLQTVEALCSRSEYETTLSALMMAAKACGKEKGLVEGFAWCKSGEKLEFHPGHNVVDSDALDKAFSAFDGCHPDFLDEIKVMSRYDEISGIKKLSGYKEEVVVDLEDDAEDSEAPSQET